MGGPRGRSASAASQSQQNAAEDVENENAAEGTVDCEKGGGGEGAEGGRWMIAGKSKRTKNICKGGVKECGLALTEKDDCIMCDMCKSWYHPKCQGLSVDAFRAQVKYDFIWLCIGCKPKFEEIIDVQKHIVSRINEAEKNIVALLRDNKPREDIGKKLEGKISNMEKVVVEKIKEQQTRTEATLKEQKEAAQAMPKYSEELKKSARELKEIVKTREDKEMREKNILIHNIPESQSTNSEERKGYDHASFQNVVAALFGESEIANMEAVSVFRMGKKTEGTTKPRLMMVKLKDRENVDKLMERRTKLRNVGFPNIYLSRDLPMEERLEQKKMREELREELNRKGKETHKIFRGRVVPREMTAQD